MVQLMFVSQLLRANHSAGLVSDFKMDIMNNGI